jgi:alkylated DNA repair dioxygenase AlkB
MADLFSFDQQFERLPIPDADISILRGIRTHMSYDRILEKLRTEVKWRQREMPMYGRKVLQPRLTAWYGDPDRQYLYSGIKNNPLPWTSLLLALKQIVEDCTTTAFNSVLLNLYRDQNDSMGFHSDDEKELGPEPCIASLSFGETRAFLFKHKTDATFPIVSVPLEEGSVLLMKGATQKNWKHAINKEKARLGPRVNLTFRYIYTSSELDEQRTTGR